MDHTLGRLIKACLYPAVLRLRENPASKGQWMPSLGGEQLSLPTWEQESSNQRSSILTFFLFYHIYLFICYLILKESQVAKVRLKLYAVEIEDDLKFLIPFSPSPKCWDYSTGHHIWPLFVFLVKTSKTFHWSKAQNLPYATIPKSSSPNTHTPGAGFQHTHLGNSNIHSMPQSWLKASWPKGIRKTGKVQAGELTWLVTPEDLKDPGGLGSEQWPSLEPTTLTLWGNWPPDGIFHPKSFPHYKSPSLSAPWVQSLLSLGDWCHLLIKGNLLLGRLA